MTYLSTHGVAAPEGADADLWERVRAIPKVVLHDHLDGGLRPATVAELAAQSGHDLPAGTVAELQRWFYDSADSGSLERYLETFVHTVAVMQTPEQLHRVAKEAVLDHAANGVIYAELRYAPELNVAGGLSYSGVIDAVREGLEAGMEEVRAAGGQIEAYQIICALRHQPHAMTAAQAAVAARDAGGSRVVGFDLAGPEAGFPATDHREALDFLRSAGMHITLHAGEADSVDSMRSAAMAGAQRFGHGVRIMDDIDVSGPEPSWGAFARWVRERQVVLEVCPRSNVQTGAAASVGQHPITLLRDLGFAVAINTDNCLMSATSMTTEMYGLALDAGWSVDQLHQASRVAWAGSFAPWESRDRVRAWLG